MTAQAPIGAPAIWRTVIDRDGGQCTCTGACGRRHTPVTCTGTATGRRQRGPGGNAVPSPVGRCAAGTGPTPERLHVVPTEGAGTDPVLTGRAPWALPAHALTTRCQDCIRTVAARPTRSTASADRVGRDGSDAGQVALFDLSPPEAATDPVAATHRAGRRRGEQ